ncbi:MAG: VWA domain-containing protein [Parachlamydiaceae bacterium]|nr:VWA domain-containing protein [Parachlamydiaceae bacterium]
MRWRAIHYDWPEISLLLFVVLFLFAAFASLYSYRQNKLAALADQRLLAFIQEPRRSLPFWVKSLLFCAAWIFGVLALMQPKGNGRYPISISEQLNNAAKTQTVRQMKQDIVFLIDASDSMNVADTQTGKTRLNEAKEIVEEIVSRLQGQNAALLAFTSKTMQLVPLTTDYLFTRLMLRQLSINEGETAGTDLLQALIRVDELFVTNDTQGQTTLIMLTDGGDTHLESLQGKEREEYMQKIVNTVRNVNTKKLQVYVVGLGSLQGKEIPGVTFKGHAVVSGLNEDLLRKISRATNGEIFLSNKMTTLQTADGILEDLKANLQFQEKIITSRIEPNQDELVYDLYYQIPLGLGIIVLSLALLLPETRRKLS